MKALKVPFSFENGKVAQTTDRFRIEEQKIVNVLVTSNFERVFRPAYGAGATTLIYELNDQLTFLDFKTEAMFELADHVRTCSVLDMQGRTDGYLENEETVMLIDVIYQIPLGVAQTTTLQIAVPGQVTEDSPF